MDKRYVLGGWIIELALFIGLLIFLSGLFANKIGIVTNNGWGLRRMATVEVGYLITAFLTVLLIQRKQKNRTLDCLILLTILQCLIVYAWYETAGTMQYIPSSSMYALQAEAFLHGHLDLLEKPDPKLLALPDPYDPLQNELFRKHDVSLYEGKYYLYWGPFPALILMGIQLLFKHTFSDAFLVILFMSGYVVFLALILEEIRTKIFPEAPVWIIVLGILVGGLINPALWLLARPAVWEAAITGGQFCLLGGIYFALSGFKAGKLSIGKFVLSGMFLACAVLSRISLGLAVIWAAISIGYAILKKIGSGSYALKALAAFGIPLILGALALLTYNALRFDSPIEVGAKYALGGVNQMELIEIGAFHSPRNVLPNINTYFFMPIQKIEKFPFINAPYYGYSIVDTVLLAPGIPNSYVITENVAGVMNTSPLFWFLTFPTLFSLGKSHYLKLVKSQIAQSNSPAANTFPNIIWLYHLFTGLFLLAMLPISLIFTSTMRYIFDFSPALYLLTFICIMQGYTICKPRFARYVYGLCVLALSLITIVNGMLLGIYSYNGHFPNHNPELFKALVGLFSFLNR